MCVLYVSVIFFSFLVDFEGSFDREGAIVIMFSNNNKKLCLCLFLCSQRMDLIMTSFVYRSFFFCNPNWRGRGGVGGLLNDLGGVDVFVTHIQGNDKRINRMKYIAHSF